MASAKPKKVDKPAPKRKNRRPKPKPVQTGQKGRPTVFSEEICERIFSYAAVGMSDERIAAAIGISRPTLDNWKKQYPDFFAALKHAKECADRLVESALLRRAKGFEHEAVKIHFGKFGQIYTKRYTERYPPDTTAAIFWLKNRQRDKWRDTSGREISGPNGGPIEGAPIRINVNLPANGYEAPGIEAPKEEGEGK